jgi:hypothetical protein
MSCPDRSPFSSSAPLEPDSDPGESSSDPRCIVGKAGKEVVGPAYAVLPNEVVSGSSFWDVTSS